jgi:hypothetical protein
MGVKLVRNTDISHYYCKLHCDCGRNHAELWTLGFEIQNRVAYIYSRQGILIPNETDSTQEATMTRNEIMSKMKSWASEDETHFLKRTYMQFVMYLPDGQVSDIYEFSRDILTPKGNLRAEPRRLIDTAIMLRDNFVIEEIQAHDFDVDFELFHFDARESGKFGRE